MIPKYAELLFCQKVIASIIPTVAKAPYWCLRFIGHSLPLEQKSPMLRNAACQAHASPLVTFVTMYVSVTQMSRPHSVSGSDRDTQVDCSSCSLVQYTPLLQPVPRFDAEGHQRWPSRA